VALFVGDKPGREVDALLHERGQVEPEGVQDAEVVSELVDLVDVVPLVGREATHDEEANGDGQVRQDHVDPDLAVQGSHEAIQNDLVIN